MKTAKSKRRVKTETSVVGKIKLFTIFLLIALQIGVIVMFNTHYALAAQSAAIVSIILSLLTCLYVLSSNKNGLSKAVWIIFILCCFTFGYIIFWLSDERIFFRGKKRYRATYDKEDLFSNANILDHSQSVKEMSSFLYSTGKFNTYDNCKGQYFSCGEELFLDIESELRKAKKFIFIEFFIIADGVLFDRIFKILEQKVIEGVEVRVIYDDLGCKKTLSTQSKRALKKAGVKLKPFNKLIPLYSVALNYRDHRKIVVIDGKMAYTGGCNLADEYTNEKTVYGFWKDTGYKVEGSAVNSFTLMFLRQWEVLSKQREDYSKYLNLHEKFANTSAVIPYADGLEYNHPIARGVYENMITSANQVLYIMTPYFVVDDGVQSLLVNKALSGVDVRIFLPGIPDKPFVYSVSRSNAEKLIDYGVKIYTVKDTFLHSKIVLTEDAVAIGSVNMDLRSFYQQFECAVYTDDKAVMDAVGEDFSSILNNSEQITHKNKWSKNIFYKIYVGVMQVFAPFM